MSIWKSLIVSQECLGVSQILLESLKNFISLWESLRISVSLSGVSRSLPKPLKFLGVSQSLSEYLRSL